MNTHKTRLTGDEEIYRELVATSVAGYAHDAEQAVRAINHATITRKPPLAPPDIDPAVGSLAGAAHSLAQAVTQLGDHLGESVTRYRLYHDEADYSGRAESTADPVSDAVADTVAVGMVYLALAAQHATQLAQALDNAHAAVAHLGFTHDETGGDR